MLLSFLLIYLLNEKYIKLFDDRSWLVEEDKGGIKIS